MRTISLSTILLSVCSNPTTKNHFHELFKWYSMFYRLHYKNSLVNRFIRPLPRIFSSLAKSCFIFAVDENKSIPSFPFTKTNDAKTCMDIR